jgi:hypothetical protein
VYQWRFVVSIPNTVLLNQSRKAVKLEINASPSVLTGTRQPLVDDGLGNMVPDPLGNPIAITCRCRVAQEHSSVAQSETFNAGLDTAFSYFVVMAFDDHLETADIVQYQNDSYRLDVVTSVKKFGGIVRYRARLIPADAPETIT